MRLIPGLGNKYLACALAAGLSAALASLAILPDPRPQDYAVLVAEVGIGVAIAIVVYGISRRNEIELTGIASEIHSMMRMQESVNRDMEQSAEHRLQTIFRRIRDAAGEVLKSKRFYDGVGADAKPHYMKEIESKCRDLANATKAATIHLPSAYWIENLEKFETLHGRCASGVVYADGEVNAAFYKAVKNEARKVLDDLRARLGQAPEAQSAGAEAGRLSVSSDRTAYPLHGRVHVRVKADRSLRGNKMRCEIRDRAEKVLWRKEIDPRNYRGDQDLAREGIFEASFKMRGRAWKVGAYAVRAACGASSAQGGFLVEQSAPVVQSDKDVYAVGSEMIITVIDQDASRDGDVAERAGDRGDSKLTIESPRGRISGYRLLETGTDTGIFQGIVRIAEARGGAPAAGAGRRYGGGRPARRLAGFLAAGLGLALCDRKGPDDGVIECGRGEEIAIKYSNKAGASARAVFAADFGATVELDQKVYTCTDRVHITVVAPEFAELQPARTGAKKPCRVSVKTSIGRLADYELAEHEPDSGVFVGSVSLTGFADMARKTHARLQFGMTGGAGPEGGRLACMNNDEVEVVVDLGDKESYRGAAITCWNVGAVQFLRPAYAVGDSAVVRIVDPDMNLDSGAIDSFSIRVVSDSDGEGIDIAVKETDLASGIFEGAFTLDPGSSSQADAALLVSNGDTVRAKYTDYTLPPPSAPSEEMEVSSSASISADGEEPPPPRLYIESIRAESETTGLGTLTAGDPAIVKVAVGGAETPYSFMVLLQIEGPEGIEQEPLWLDARIDPHETLECEFRWLPPGSGRFVLAASLFKGLDDPAPLCLPEETEVSVV